MATETRERVHPYQRIDDGATYVVVGTAKDQADATREAFRGTYDEADEYIERNTSPDNYERYHLERVVEVVRTIDVDVPSSVWYDALDPLASAMQGELGLPEPETVRRGKGSSERYRDVPCRRALELAEYLTDRAEGLLMQDAYGAGTDPDLKAERDCYRAAIKCAARIRAQVEAVT